MSTHQPNRLETSSGGRRGGQRHRLGRRYNLADRSIERALLPWCERQFRLMAYSPLGSTGDLLRNPALIRVAEKRQVSPAAVALAWAIRSGRVIAIPGSGS